MYAELLLLKHIAHNTTMMYRYNMRHTNAIATVGSPSMYTSQDTVSQVIDLKVHTKCSESWHKYQKIPGTLKLYRVLAYTDPIEGREL